MIGTLAFRTGVIVAAAAMLCASAIPAVPAEGPYPPTDLRCEYLINPMGIDAKRPRFSWILGHSQRGQKQSAYQVIVSTRPDTTSGDQWDSGRVASDQSIQVAYEGKPLDSNRTYFWKVRFWDKDERPSGYSEAARFDTAMLSPGDWKAQWISGKGRLRKEFTLPARVARARAYVTGLGYYELYLNGRKVGRNVLDPGWTTYEKRILYSTYDVTDLLQPGVNAIGAMLGQGWYKWVIGESPRLLLVQLEIDLEGGEHVRIATDNTWKSIGGPILYDHVWHGEEYDARLDTPGWDTPGFDDGQGAPAKVLDGPGGVLSAQTMPPIEVIDTLLPLKMSTPASGVYVFDMGQNFSGWVALRVRGPSGTRLRLRYAELLDENGMLDRENLRTARAQDTYILRGDTRDELYEPRFTYHGFRYVELTGFPGVPTVDTLRGKLVHSAVEPAGSFAASKPILNALQHVVVWSRKTNLHSIPTDCDQRDERMGWLDQSLTAEDAILNFDMAAFYSNFLRDIRDAQDESGAIPDTVPYRYGQRSADPVWGSSYPLLCWYMYQNYGDRRLLEEHYDAVRRYVESLHLRAKNGLLQDSHDGDWIAIEKPPGSLVSSFFYYEDVTALARIAAVLGKTDDARRYGDLGREIRKAFHTRYFDAERKSYGDATQTATALALYAGMVPDAERELVIRSLLEDIIYRHDTHLTTGAVGTKYIMEVLTQIGRADLAYDLAIQTTYPSWGYMIERGATTLWETWQYQTGPGMNSHNHPLLGSVGAWLYKALAGINSDPEMVAYRRITLAPEVVRDLRHVAASLRTVRGVVSSAWARNGDGLHMEVTIPVGSDAEIRLPELGLVNAVVRESGAPVWEHDAYRPGVPGVTGAKRTPPHIIVTVGSGTYALDLTGE